MPLPSNLQTITVTGTYLDSTGAALSGTISFVPPPELVDVATAIMYAAPVTATLSSNGTFSVTLICTDNSTLAPAGWGYTVTEAIKGNRSYTIYVPHTLGSSVDISSLVPLPDLTGAPVPQTVAAIAPGYAALAYNQTWTGAQTFDGAVSFATTPTLPGGTLDPLDWINVKTQGAMGDGSTDDTAAIQAALDATPRGGVTYFPAGVYRTSAPLIQQPYTTAIFTHGSGQFQMGGASPYSSIKPLPSFAGAAVWRILDENLGGFASPTILAEGNSGAYQVVSAEYAIQGMSIDGSALTASNVNGIDILGQVQDVYLRDVDVQQCTGDGINSTYNFAVANGPQAPFAIHFERIAIQQCTGTGIVLSNATDSTFMDCYVLGCGSFGWWIAWPGNSLFVACRAEWSGYDGFHVTAQGGQTQFIGCSTDRNNSNGMYITGTGTPGGIVSISGLMLNRDGKNNDAGGGGFAGLNVAGTNSAVVVDGLTVWPGYDDGGGGTLSPEYGVTASNQGFLAINTGMINGATAAWFDGGGNTTILRGANVVEGTGQTIGTSVPGIEITRTGATVNGTLTVTGATTLDVAPTIPGGSAVALGWVNAKAYGALGNGTHDDTTAIQAAINALGANGGVVYLPATTNGYLLNSAALTCSNPGTVLRGDGSENTKLLIGASFTGTSAVIVNAYNCQVIDLSIDGVSSTTTTNPAANGIEVSGQRRTKVIGCTFYYINGWAIEAKSTTTNGSSNCLGTMISKCFMQSCAGGIHFQGNTTQAWAFNSQISDVQMYGTGVTTGPSANLDCIKIEDAWDSLLCNNIAWMGAGSGASLHIKGFCAATFVTNLDALGTSAGPTVLIEDSTNGSSQNTQIFGGVIQQGAPGVMVTGGASQFHLNTSRIINNFTHGVQIAGTNTTIYLDQLFFSLNGQGATGTNYDINWSGSAVGFATSCRFATPIVTTGTAGVQFSVNIASAGQNVRFINTSFQGTGANSANWFTNLPSAVLDESNGGINFYTSPTFASTGTALTSKGNIALQPAASGNTVISGNYNSASFDNLRILLNSISMGPGTTGRDVQLARTAVGVAALTNPLTSHGAIYEVDGNVIVGGTATLGDNGVGEVAFTNASTVPTTNPSGGAVMYANGGLLYNRDPNGITYLMSRQTSAGAGATVTGVTAATLLASGMNVPAGTLAAGVCFKVKAWGNVTTTVDSQTVTLTLYWGGVAGTSLLSWGAQTPNSSAVVTGAAWMAEWTVVATSSTQLATSGWDGWNYFFSSLTDTGLVTVSNTSAEQLVIGATPSATAVSVTCIAYEMERVG